MKRNILLFVIMILNVVQIFAQLKEDHSCVLHKQYIENPGLKPENNPKAKAFLDNFTKEYKNKAKSMKADPVLRIPVVFHVVRDEDGNDEDISASQIEEALVMVNEDYSRNCTRRDNIHPNFASLEAKVGFRFELAKYDPDGYPTNGITRTQSVLSQNGGQIELKELIHWPREEYLNIWVVLSSDGGSGSAFAFLPPSVADRPVWDGIVTSHWAVGRTGTAYDTHLGNLTHEIGHWANLNHTWGPEGTVGDDGNCDQDDGISDTPNTMGNSSNGDCGKVIETCGSQDNISNFMDYSCEVMFTTEQRQVMRAALNSPVSGRNNLWTSPNLKKTGLNQSAVHALFKSNVDWVEPRGSVTFSNESTVNSGGSINSWQWSFPGGSPSSYNGKNPPAITYSTKGVYEVSLTVSNNSGSDTRVRKEQIDVNNNYIMTNGETVTTDAGWFYDSGFKGHYSNDENMVMTIKPSTSGKVIELEFFEFSMEAYDNCEYDYFEVYDGTSTSASLIGKYCGKAPEPTIRATNNQGALTIKFVSDDNSYNPGWKARIQAVDPGYTENVYLMGSESSVTTCSGVFYDSGKNLNYKVDENSTMTFLPASSGAKITAEFLEFWVEADGCEWDYLEIFDGKTTSSSLIGKYCGTNSPGSVTATNSDGALTFKFTSDDNTVFNGWKANISCEGGTSDTEAPSTPTNLSYSNVKATSVDLSWTASTDNKGVAGYDILSGSSVIENSTGSSVTVGGLNPETQYTLRVRAKDAAGNISGLSNSVTFTTDEQGCVYCPSASNRSSYEHIVKVEVGSFTKTSGAANYTDFTNEVIDISKGENTDITLTPGFSGSSYNEYFRVWIDLNGDCDFNDSGEMVFDAGSASSSAVSGNINIPSSAITGETRMRVSMKYNAAPNACDNGSDFGDGEVEDYTVNIVTGGGDTTPPSTPTNLSSSNVTETTVDLSWTASTDNIGVEDYQVMNGSTVLKTVNGTSTTVTGLIKATQYTLRVRARDAAGNISDLSNSVTFTTDGGGCSYCPSASNRSSYEHIAQVKVGSFTKNSGAAKYTDFTGEVIEISKGQNISITLTPGFSGDPYNEYFRVWIDLNGDCDFSDSNEMVFDAGSASSSAVSGTINLPSSAITGQTRMRVSMKYNGAPNACDNGSNFGDGEVEDYTVNIVTDGGDTTPPSTPTNLSYSNVTKNSVYLNWNASTDNEGVTGYDVMSGSSVVKSSNGTSTTVSGLSAGTQYTFRVRAKDAAGNLSGLSNSVTFTTDPDVNDPTYCSAQSNSTSYERITRVRFGSIDQSSGSNGYEDFTSVSTNLNAGSATTLSITTTGNYDDDEIVVFIDYNRDGDFTDSGEEVYHNTNAGSAQTYSASVTAPSNAASGNLRMRIILFDASYDSKSSCGGFDYGEVEDYTINIGTSAPLAKSTGGILMVYPNPNDGAFTVELSQSKQGMLKLYNAEGIMVAVEQINGEKIFSMDMDVAPGIYILKVVMDDEVLSKEIIIR